VAGASPAVDAAVVAAAVVPGSAGNLAGRPSGSVKAAILIRSMRKAKEELYGHEIAYDF
jgi:hypothetical protein